MLQKGVYQYCLLVAPLRLELQRRQEELSPRIAMLRLQQQSRSDHAHIVNIIRDRIGPIIQMSAAAPHIESTLLLGGIASNIEHSIWYIRPRNLQIRTLCQGQDIISGRY